MLVSDLDVSFQSRGDLLSKKMSRRKRAKVDYVALAEQLEAEKAQAKKAEDAAPAESSTSALLGDLDEEEEAKSVYSAEEAEAEAKAAEEEDQEAEAAEEAAKEDDWRKQLYRWKGKIRRDRVSEGGDKYVLVWTGHWGKKTGNTTQYSSKQTFTVKGPQVEGETADLPETGTYSGEYMMDNDGSGELTTFSDPPYVMSFADQREKEGVKWCGGAGSNEFG